MKVNMLLGINAPLAHQVRPHYSVIHTLLQLSGLNDVSLRWRPQSCPSVELVRYYLIWINFKIYFFLFLDASPPLAASKQYMVKLNR